MKILVTGSNGFVGGDLAAFLTRPTTAAPATLTLLIENQEFFTQVSFPYEGGLKEPHLERDDSKPALLDQILAPRKAP